MSQHTPKQWFNLEERFFSEVDNKLLDQLRGEMTTAQNAEAISRVLGISDMKLAEEIAQQNITVETLAAFRLAPLVAVAWADDRVEENERYEILRSAEKAGIATDGPAMELLKLWTVRRPPHDLLDAWCDYASTLVSSLSEPHRASLRKEILGQTEGVAEASGGFLGFGSVSSAEKAVIQRVDQALS